MRVKNYDVEGLESCVGVMCVWLTGGGGWWCWGWHGNIGVIGSGDRIRLCSSCCNSSSSNSSSGGSKWYD